MKNFLKKRDCMQNCSMSRASIILKRKWDEERRLGRYYRIT